MAAKFELSDIQLQKNGVDILTSVSLNADAGKSMSIIGESGSGKSSLLRLITAVDKPDSGVIEIDGNCITNLSPKQAAKLRQMKFGISLQLPHLIPSLSVQQNVKLALDIQQKTKVDKKTRTLEMLERFKIDHKAKSSAYQLSGGELRRVSLARAFASLPEIVVLDEPTTGLDDASAKEVIRAIFDLHSKYSISLLMATHYLGVAHMTDHHYDLDLEKQLR